MPVRGIVFGGSPPEHRLKSATARAHVYEPTSDAVRGTRLSSHTDRSGTTVHGRASMGFGSVFAIAGIALAVAAMLERLDMAPGAPWWLGVAGGGLFAMAGMSFVLHGVVGIQAQRRVRRLRETHVREPWVWDHPWDDQGSRDDSGRRIARAIWSTVIIGLFLVPFNWVGFLSPERPVAFAVMAVLMDILLVACVWRTARLIMQRRKYGPTMLRFRRFPFRPGQEVELHMARPPHLAGIEAPVAVFRCVEERYEMQGSGKNRSKVVVAYELWSDRQRAEFRRGEFTWRFSVPEGIPGTALSERPPRYWELDLKIEVPGVDYAGTFLVPVYADGRRRSGASQRCG